jgi:hypothetical protein
MNQLHPWLLAFSVLSLCVGGIWAGYVHPFGRYVLKWPHFREGYSTDPNIAAVCMSAFVPPFILTLFLWHSCSVHGYPAGLEPSIFFPHFWWMMNYWTHSPEYASHYLLFWYIYASLFLTVPMNIIFALVGTWKPLPTHVVQAGPRHGCIIVTHNSSDKIRPTVQALFAFLQPHQVFIADNGSSLVEQQMMDEICAEMSREYWAERGIASKRKIRVSHLKYGNKTLAQYACVHELDVRFQSGKSPIDIITLIDDDVIVPDTFPSDTIERQLEDPTLAVLAYPLCAANPDDSIWTAMQTVEYLQGNVSRMIQYLLGSQLFASGAIATWRLGPLRAVLDRHCTTFNGEDLEMGVILHRLSDYKTPKLGCNDSPVRIGLVRDCIVPTILPIHYLHWYDLLPNPMRRAWKVVSCACGEHSFFNQRFRSWDPASHQFLWKFLKVLFSPRGGRYGPKVFIRVLVGWKLLSVLREYFMVAGLVLSFVQITTAEKLLFFGIFIVDNLSICWGLALTSLVAQSWNQRPVGLRFSPDILYTYPVVFDIPYVLFIRVAGIFYAFLYYMYFVPFPKDVRIQKQTDQAKSDALETSWARSFTLPRGAG